MKKIGLICLVISFIGISIYSCTKQEVINNSAPANTTMNNNDREQTFEEWYAQNKDRLSEVTRSEIIAFNNIETQKSIFRVIPDERKVFVWKEKYGLLMNAPGYTQEQKDFFNTCVSYLVAELYSSDAYLNQKHNEIQALRTTGESLFTREQLVIIMAYLGDVSKPWSGANEDACECSTQSDWCDFPVDIGGHCDSHACTKQSKSGCGSWWSYQCSGDCVI